MTRYAACAVIGDPMRLGVRAQHDPESYGTLSHLCASVVHESASSIPETRWRSFGDTRPRCRTRRRRAATRGRPGAASAMSPSGSKAPVLTSPACAQTIAGPCPSRQRAGERVDAHAALVVGGDDGRRAEAEQPQCAIDRDVALGPGEHADARCALEPVAADVPAHASRTWWRAAARPVTCAIWCRSRNRSTTRAGKPSSSRSSRA